MKSLIEVCGRKLRIEGRVLRIAYPHGDRYRFVDDPQQMIDGLRRSRARVDLFSFAQKLPESQPQFSYPFEWDNYAVLPVTTFETWWTDQVGAKTRNLVRLAEKKGVVLREAAFDDSLVAGIRAIYNECPIRQKRRFRHYGKDLETVRRDEATFLDSSIFIGAYLEDNLIGFAKLVPNETGTQAGLMNILSMVKHRDKAPQNALIAQAVRVCERLGIQHLVYSKFDYGKSQQDGLRKFKEHNGFGRVDTPRYFVPITAMGQVAFRLGWHHSISERVPEALASRLRDFRAAWYERRYRSAMEAL